MAGYPVALTLAGVSLIFALLGDASGVMRFAILGALPQRIFGVMTNEVLLAIPLFIFMGVMLERSRIAEDLLETMGRLFGTLRGGLGIFRGHRRHAARRRQRRRRRDDRDHGPDHAAGDAALRLRPAACRRHSRRNRDAGADIPARDRAGAARRPARQSYQAAQLSKGIFRPAVAHGQRSVRRRAGARLSRWSCCICCSSSRSPFSAQRHRPRCRRIPKAPRGFALARRLVEVLVAPLLLIVAVLGSILGGIATPTEAASIGAVGAILLAARKTALAPLLRPVCETTTQIVSMIFLILIGATMFSLVFRALGGDDMVHRALSNLPGGPAGAVLAVMLAMFLLGFVMDAFEIIFVVVPIVAPTLLTMPGVDPVWLGIMMAVNLQTSYMHPPLGPTLFFLRGVAPPEITTRHIYVGIIPFVLIQLFALVVLWFVPGLATALPHALYGH